MNMSKEEAVKFFEEFYKGSWRFPAPIKRQGTGWGMLCAPGENLSTYDDDKLTRLVFMAHRDAYRVHIESAGMLMRIVINKRVLDADKKYYERHPSIEEALDNWNNCD